MDLHEEYRKYVELAGDDPITFEQFCKLSESMALAARDESQSNLELLAKKGSLDFTDKERLEIEQAMNRVLTDHRLDLQAFMVALARRKIARMERVLRYVESLENRLVNEVNGEGLTPHDILRLYEGMKSSIDRDLALIQSVSEGNQIPIRPRPVSAESTPLPREARIRLQNLISRIESRIFGMSDGKDEKKTVDITPTTERLNDK